MMFRGLGIFQELSRVLFAVSESNVHERSDDAYCSGLVYITPRNCSTLFYNNEVVYDKILDCC